MLIIGMSTMVGQTSNTVDINSLPPDIQEQIKREKFKTQYSEYTAMAEAFGIAIGKGLGAITHNVEQFSQTSAGKLTICIIGYKLIGKDILRVIIGFGIMVMSVLTIIIFWYKSCIPHRYVIKNDDKGKAIQWEVTPSGSYVNTEANMFWFIGLIICIATSSLIMFA